MIMKHGKTVSIGVAMAFVMVAGMSCSPRVIEHTVVHTDTCYVQQVRRDSIFVQDSIAVEKYYGDTVKIFVDRWHTRYREHYVRDTLYVARTDTVVCTETQTVTVERPLTRWQKTQIVAGRIALCLLATGIVALLMKIRGRLLPI